MVFIIISSHFLCRFDLQYHDQRSRANQNAAYQRLRGEFFMQEDKGQYKRDDHAQLVDGYDLGRFPGLQRLVLAKP